MPIPNECLACPWATFTAEPGAKEVGVGCVPPMGECPGEFPPKYDSARAYSKKVERNDGDTINPPSWDGDPSAPDISYSPGDE